MKPDDYWKDGYGGGWGCEYEPSGRWSFTVIDVLDFLVGRPWDEVALSYVSGLRPSKIRLTTGSVKLDAKTWRVTVYLSERDKRTITRISQEIGVDLFGDIEHGEDLHSRLS